MSDRKTVRRLALATCRVDGGTQARASVDDATIDDYAAAMTFGTTFPPVVVFFDGDAYWLADGFHRFGALSRLGRTFLDAEVLKGSQRDALLYAVGANQAHGLRRTNADKRRSVELLLNDDEWRKWSDREIARRCGVSNNFVSELRSLSSDDSDNGARTYRDKHGNVSTMARRHTVPIPSPLSVHFSSDTPEHYTPRVVIDAAIACLGAINLDPCSNTGTPNVPARSHFTEADDGLSQPWSGRVYMNPPYGREIDAWIEKLIAEHARPDGVTEAIALLPARTDTQWFQRLRDFFCCFIVGRLTFIGNDDPAPFPSVVFYLGDEPEKFHHTFSALGDIWQRMEEFGS